MSRNRNIPSTRLSIFRQDSDYYVLKFGADLSTFPSLSRACRKAIEIVNSSPGSRYNVIGIGAENLFHFSLALVGALAEFYPLWWEYDGITYTLIAQTARYENGNVRTRRLNSYATAEFAEELHRTLVNLRANIASNALEQARFDQTRREVYQDQKATQRMHTLIQQGGVR